VPRNRAISLFRDIYTIIHNIVADDITCILSKRNSKKGGQPLFLTSFLFYYHFCATCYVKVLTHCSSSYGAVHLATVVLCKIFPHAIKNTDFISLGKMFLLKIETNPQEGFF
jgi:hypothetical protein